MKLQSKITLSVVCGLYLAGTTLQADSKQLDTMIVSATKTENSLKNTSVSAEIITAEDVTKKGATRLREVLRDMAGISNPSQDSLSIRGFSADHTLILIDGKRVTGEVGGSYEIDRIDISNIERIEIIKGAASALFGTDALGGVVNIITKKSVKEPSTTITAQYGSHGSDGARSLLSISSNIPVNEDLTVNLRASSQKLDTLDDENKMNSIQKDGSVKTIGLDAHYKITQNDTLSLGIDNMEDEGENYLAGGAQKSTDDNSRQNYSLAWEKNTDKYNAKVRIYKSEYEKSFEMLQVAQNKVAKYITADRETNVLEAQLSVPFNSHVVTSGLEFRNESFDGSILNTGNLTSSGVHKGFAYQKSKIEIDYKALFIQDEWFVNDKLSLVGSLRYDDSDKFENELSPKLGMVYHLSQKANNEWRIKANYTHGFKTPTPADMYVENVRMDKGMIIQGNPDVTAEKSDNYDIALEANIGKLDAKIGVFQSDVEDLIGQVFTGKVNPSNNFKILTMKNISEATLKGLELEAVYKINDNNRVTFNYTFLDAKGDTLDGPLPMANYVEKKLEQRPDSLANLRLDSHIESIGLDVTLRGEYVNNMLINYERNAQNQIIGENNKSYTLGHINVAKNFSNGFQVFAGIDNITDKTDNEVPLHGRFTYAGVKYTF